MATNSITFRLKLTSAAVAQKLVPPPPDVNQITLYDTDVTGFGVYRTSEKPGTYFVHFRIGKRQRKKNIGRVTEINVTDARAEAIQLKLAGGKGQDLIQERKLALERGLTLGDAYAEFLQALERKGGSPATFRNYDQNWQRGLKVQTNMPLCEVSKTCIRRWHSKWGERGPTLANQTLRLFRAIYNHALRTTDGLPPNPSIAVDVFNERRSRPILTWEMLQPWLGDVERLENPIRRAFCPFLLYSGLRKTDALNIRWDEVYENRLHRPNPKGGRHRPFDLPLSTTLSRVPPTSVAPNTLYSF